MKRIIPVLLLAPLLLFACVHKGAQSKDVKCYGYQLVGDGNDNDSTFFQVTYENKSTYPLLKPYVRLVIKDTSSKTFKPILFSASLNLDDQPVLHAFNVLFYSDGFQFSDNVGKVKCYLSWTNSKGHRSIRRKVEY